MAQTTFSVNMDENLKAQLDSLCTELGMNVSAAVSIFAKAAVRDHKIPLATQKPMHHEEIFMDDLTEKISRIRHDYIFAKSS